jgi:hypothetical protein
MCAPASRSILRIHSVERRRPLFEIFSQPRRSVRRKPSRETDIFNTSFLFVVVAAAVISPESCDGS